MGEQSIYYNIILYSYSQVSSWWLFDRTVWTSTHNRCTWYRHRWRPRYRPRAIRPAPGARSCDIGPGWRIPLRPGCKSRSTAPGYGNRCCYCWTWRRWLARRWNCSSRSCDTHPRPVAGNAVVPATTISTCSKQRCQTTFSVCRFASIIRPAETHRRTANGEVLVGPECPHFVIFKSYRIYLAHSIMEWWELAELQCLYIYIA